MTLISTILNLVPETGCGVKQLLAHEQLRKFDKLQLDAALMGLKSSGRVRLVLGALVPANCASDPEYRSYRKKHQREALS